jgi:8-oxo-dGTP pyrophosphatase MutT (NUDIX family)
VDTPSQPRDAGRVLVLDPAGRVLLFQGFNPAHPGELFWFTIGGGAEPGETMAQTAARELREETGIEAEPAELGPSVWQRRTYFSYDGMHFRQQEEYFVLRPGDVTISLDGLDTQERETLTAHRWWGADEIEAATSAGELFFPAELPALLRRLS